MSQEEPPKPAKEPNHLSNFEKKEVEKNQEEPSEVGALGTTSGGEVVKDNDESIPGDYDGEDEGDDREHVIVERLEYRAPLPPPPIIAAYENFYPGFTKTYVDAVLETIHTGNKVTENTTAAEIKNSARGINYGFILGMTGLILGATCILLGHTTGGSILGGGSLVSLVAVFITGTRMRLHSKGSLQKTENKAR